ncbi:DUF6339 family protein [Nocardia jinanensis]|uniref:Uncharacterized protein n=1 Tax=Nocardia jinanensis TaxID=382504 RepID=A0A917R9D4_9NOCA|nr:DUF6339 family protein [Nocardia jinanensis]GGK97015.1 hypothetical protein GCM10011588_09340 [Nocardia jinanensis]
MLLYPRLLRSRARELAGRYREQAAGELSREWKTRDESAVFVATGGTRVSEDRLRWMRETIVDLARESAFPEAPDPAQKVTFDLSSARILHREMRIAPAEAAAGDVWAFLALVLLPDIAHWRYPRPPGDRVLGTDLTRHVFGRLWWRSQFVHSSSEPDPYAALSILGESAFDQIYARRASLGGSPHLIKSILRVWRTLDLTGLQERDLLRDFLKRLLRLAPFVMFEALDEQALDEELLTVARETILGVLESKGMDTGEAVVRADRATRVRHPKV